MGTAFKLFERIVRESTNIVSEGNDVLLHPFEIRNIHPSFPIKVRRLFDDGHCAEATFLAMKCVEKAVQKHSGKKEFGQKLMMSVFDKNKPLIQLNPLSNASEEDEQEGYRFLFSGAVQGIRNPGGHEIELSDDPDVCLDHLAFASLLLRRLERSGFK
ncbi:TIGR02391 family protein [Sodalis sp. dw_96]|uniref:TIGR02391 family protein n=1 Tax=Sodalis sp. dw_96 TaxID=2719794 RepID=UPI001BD4F3C9|nr:TIGR02391 family protein [Sodalis sp. dw_96]